MSDVKKTLDERGTRYGDFSDHARICQVLKHVMMEQVGWLRLNDVQRQALDVIADKIARILSGDPNYTDNWHDIQGYAKLVEDRLPKTEKDVESVGGPAQNSAMGGKHPHPHAYTWEELVGGLKLDVPPKKASLLTEDDLSDLPEELRGLIKMMEQAGAKIVVTKRML